MRIAVVYDCLFPHSVGGAERWYRALAERLAESHEITYLTRRQWGQEGPGTPFEAIAVSPGGELYTRGGRRRIWPPIRFGIGVFWHLLRHGGRYDAVHSASFPYFSLLGATLALRLRRSCARLVVDWFEVWGRGYWVSYLGPIGGRIGHAVQRLCVRLPDHSFTFSRMHAARLAEEGHRAPVTRLTGAYAGEREAGQPRTTPAAPPTVLFAGRHIPEKRVPAIPPAIAAARDRSPQLRGLILGDGPETGAVREAVERLGLGGAVEIPGRVSSERVREAMRTAACLLLPSEREGYGLVVVEAVSAGTPAIVVAGPENAATELIEEGQNGFVAASAEPGELAAAIARVIEGGEELRRSTLRWYRENGAALSIESSLGAVERSYEAPGGFGGGEPAAHG